jgi:integrase/recombinase XerD
LPHGGVESSVPQNPSPAVMSHSRGRPRAAPERSDRARSAAVRTDVLGALCQERSIEVGALLVAAELGPAAEHTPISLLALNGLRVAEAIGADIEALSVERGHRTLTIVRKGRKTVTIPLAPRTARAVDLAVGERASGPIFMAVGGHRPDRHGASPIVRRVARRAGLAKTIGPHTLRHAFITPALDAGCRCATCKRPRLTPTPARPMRYDRARVCLDRYSTYIAGAAR